MGFPPSTGGSPTGSAGGDLTGTYPNPNIGSGKVTVADLASAVTLDAVAAANATAGNVAMVTHKLTGLAAGTGNGDSLRYEDVIGATMAGDLSGTFPNPTIGANKVTTAKLAAAVTVDAIATANATAADVVMNTHKLTGLSAGTAAGHSVRYEQVFGGATTGSLGVVLGQSGTIAAHTGDLTETVLATVAIPAAFLGANGYVQVYATYTRNGSGTSAVTVRARFGASGSGITGTSIAGTPTLTTAQLSSRGYVDFANANSASSQVVLPSNYFSPYAQNAGALTASSINTANASEVNLTGQLANTGDTVNLVSYLVIAYPHA